MTPEYTKKAPKWEEDALGGRGSAMVGGNKKRQQVEM